MMYDQIVKVKNLRLDGLKLITPDVVRDSRGYFLETYRASRYETAGIGPFVQDNHSYSQKDTLRGLHLAAGQAKLVGVAVGKIFDVAVDVRADSPTFGQWEGVTLDDEQCEQLYIPPGFAHGFCVLSDEAHVLYKVGTEYDPTLEQGFAWNDPQVGIEWPIDQPILSERDKNAPSLAELQ